MSPYRFKYITLNEFCPVCKTPCPPPTGGVVPLKEIGLWGKPPGLCQPAESFPLNEICFVGKAPWTPPTGGVLPPKGGLNYGVKNNYSISKNTLPHQGWAKKSTDL